MRGGRRSFLLLCSLGTITLGGAQPADVTGMMPEAYFPGLKSILKTAWSRSPEKIEKELEIAQQEARSYILNAQRLPNATAWVDLARNQTAISGAGQSQSTDTGLFYRLELTQSIFRWGELQNRSALARLGVLMAEKSFTAAARLLAVTLRQSYLQLIVKKAALKQVRLAQQFRTEELKVLRDKRDRGLASTADVAGWELGFNEQAVQLAIVEEDFTAARRLFARLAGLPELPEEEVPDTIPKPAYSSALTHSLLADLLRDGGKFSFEAEVNALRAEEAELNYRIARVRLLPKFDALASYGLQNLATANNNGVSQTGVTIQTVGLRVTWSIFDGLATRGEKQQALATKRLYERRFQTAAEVALEEVQGLGRKLDLDARMLEFGDTRLNVAVLSEQRMKDESQLGNVPQTAIDATRLQRYQAEVNNATARANFLGTWSVFVSRAGLDPLLNTLPARHAREKR